MKLIVYALALALTSLSATWAQCNQYNLRREIRQISSSERDAFIKAVNDLKRSGRYDELVSIHLRYVSYAHSTPAFFPWHRQYIRIFELALQRFNPSVVLPYWDWTLDSQAPEESPIWEWFGGNGREGDSCVVDGPFAFWRARNPRPHCLQRQWDSGDKISAFWSPESINHFIGVSRSFDNLRNNIEPGPHGSVHNNIGGDFRYMTSANDPIFFLHHAFVDKIWADWQRSHRSMANDYGGVNLVDGRNATVNDNLPPFNTRVRQILNTDNLCYRYSQSQSAQFQPQETHTKRAITPFTEKVTPASKIESLLKNILSYIRPDYSTLLGLPSSTDRETQLSKLRPPRGLDEDFSNMMGYDIQEPLRQSTILGMELILTSPFIPTIYSA
ncbi:Di-copper centre-containing protein [Basidiobolus meristosporus CBS 931.73]|uniref:Di-copper centre-containing protein n=1 Tax=Basidiobolus meristosporus CBS 931.73 TaxID=1314790 RepID=A0A1Y1YDM8_9FUNG|nr:Di-copper centre-containing protein [Basidiobolus meristosporus CBS 931.73]|eukprot:ORX96097.1 Di-copper centre-containing protein [Basidiobolus meristosporus CBS 931.73]